MPAPHSPFRHHVLVCAGAARDRAAACAACGGPAVAEALGRELAARDLQDDVLLSVCDALGPCAGGPTVVVYPDGVWYPQVTPADVPEIVAQQLEQGRAVERLLARDPAALGRAIVDEDARRRDARRLRDTSATAPDDVLDLLRGYQSSHLLLTALQLDLFTAVARCAEAATAATVAAAVEAEPRATEMVLNALAGLGLLTKEGARFANTPVGARFLVAGSPDDARLALGWELTQVENFSTLTECVRRGRSVLAGERTRRGSAWTEPFIAAMEHNAAERAARLVRAVGLVGVTRVLDVGGGSGAFAREFARAGAAAGVQAEVLDLPAVVRLAAPLIAKEGLADRVRTRAADLRTADLGADFDVVLVSAVCHMLRPDQNADLLGRCRQALAPRGRVVIHDYVMNDAKTAPVAGALFALLMLVGTPGGTTYSEAEYAAFLRGAGLVDVQRLPFAGPTGLMVGRRP